MTKRATASHSKPPQSFASRQGRITRGQRRALQELLPPYRIPDEPRCLDWAAVFGRDVPVAMEIGFGSGEALLGLARRYPEWDWVGVEVYPPGIGKLLLALEAEPLANVRVADSDAVELVAERTPSASLDAVYIFFPDPWPKARHHKRRLIQRLFLDRLATAMRPEADLFLATDWPDYAEWMRVELEGHTRFANAHGPWVWAPRCPDRPRTRFEERGETKGHPVFDLHYRLT